MLRRRSASSSSSSSLSRDDRSPACASIDASACDQRPHWSEPTTLEEEESRLVLVEGISEWEAGVSLAKAIMGAGSFALPWAFSKMGYLAGPMVLVIFLALSVYSIGLLGDSARWLRNKNNSNSNSNSNSNNNSNNCSSSSATWVSYVDVARATFGPTGAALAYTASIASSIGVCGSYLVFVAVNLSALLGMGNESSPSIGESESGHERRLFLVLVWMVALPIAVLLSSVRDPKVFAAVSMWGDLSVVAGMLAVVVYGVAFAESNTTSALSNADCVAIGSIGDMALALGSIGYLFLIHFLVLPIESSMGEMANAVGRLDIEADYDGHILEPNRKQGRFQKVVIRTFLVCGGIGGTFGIIGYFLFGTNTQQIVLLNVEGSIGMAIVQSLLCIDLLLTYPVVMRPSISILEEHWKRLLTRKKLGLQEQIREEGGKNEEGMQMVSLVKPSRMSGSDTKRLSSTLDSEDSNVAHSLSGKNHIRPEEQSSVVLTSWNHMVVCLSLGVVAAGAGSFVPAFGLLSGLVGGVSQTFLAFVLPPLMWAKQQQLQNSSLWLGGSTEPSAWVFIGILPLKEKALVLCGLGLIGWTLQSTWAELSTDK